MTKLRSGSSSTRFSVCGESAHKPERHKRTTAGYQFLLAFAVVSVVATTPDSITSFGLAHATQENPLGEEIQITEQTDLKAEQSSQDTGTSNPINTLPLPSNSNSNSDQQSCQIVVTAPGTMGSSIENKVLSSKLIGGRAGTANITATNSSYSLSVDNPFGFSAMPPGGNANVVMKASFMGNGDTNFSETPGDHEIRLKRGLTVVQAHLTAERTDGNPFPAGSYRAELTLRCE